jgi:hypothetical protein
MDLGKTDLQMQALALPEKAKSVQIVDQISYEKATEIIKSISAMKKSIEEHYAPMKKKAFETHKTIVAEENKYLKPLAEADLIIRSAANKYLAEQEALRQAEIKRQQAEQRKLEEDERLARAAEAEAAGKTEVEVNQILETETPLPPPVVKPTIKQPDRVFTRQTWRAEVVDLKQLCAAIGKGLISTEAVLPNKTYLNSLAREKKETLFIPGIIVKADTGLTIK